MTASLFVLAMAMCEFPNTMTASRHLDRVNWTETREKKESFRASQHLICNNTKS